ncbi:MAG: hypothetical protein AB1564_17325 [Chloroflexota bacterium]
MEWFSTLTSLIIGFVLRFGLPIAVTIVIIHVLRRLDERWQAEAKAENQAALVSARVNGKRCWEVKGCSNESLAQCPAAALQQPCWQTFRLPNGHLRETCLGCDVFLKAPAPTATHP